MEECKICEFRALKGNRDRPLFCCSCELRYLWNKMLLEIPGYRVLIKILDWMTRVLEKIATKISVLMKGEKLLVGYVKIETPFKRDMDGTKKTD